jgi:hypothetical protein
MDVSMSVCVCACLCVCACIDKGVGIMQNATNMELHFKREKLSDAPWFSGSTPQWS